MNFSTIWAKIKAAYTGPKAKFFWFATLATLVFIFIWLVGPGNTVGHWVKAGIENRRLEKAINQYEEQNAQMQTRLNMLRNDQDTLEKFAREQFQFAEPGEDVYVIK